MGVFYYINNYMPKEHAVIVYGRFQPPTLAHHMVAQKAKSRAQELGGDHFIYGSHSEGSEDNPLFIDKKRKHMKTVLATDNVIIDPELKGIAHILAHVHDKGYKKITLIAGADRVEGFEKFKQYFGKKTKSSSGAILDLSNIHPDNFNVESAGDRDPDSDPDPSDIKSVSGTKMRKAADSGDFETFKGMLPTHVSRADASEMMSDVKSGIDQSRQSKKKKKIKESASPATRMKLAKAARRTARRRALIRKMRSKRRKNIPQLKKRAKNEVKDQLRKRVYKGNWKKLSYAQRATIDKMINKRKPMIDNMVKKIMPQVIKGETQRLRNLNSSFDPVIDNFVANYLTEVKKMKSKSVRRKPQDTEGKVRRRAQNRVNKRAQRSKESNARQAGNFKNNIMVVKSKNGDVEIIDKESYNPQIHQVLVDAEKANKSNVSQFLKNKAFANTVTSERLFGYIEGMGDGKSDKKGKSEAPKEDKPKKEKKKESTKQAALPPPMVVATKKSRKKDTFPTTHGAGDMEAGMAYSVNTAYGMSPSQIKSKGLIADQDLQSTITNPHESFMPSCSRAAQALMKTFPGLFIKHTGRMKSSTLTPEATKNGVSDKTAKSDLIAEDANGNPVAGISVKMGGESQLTSGSPAETSNFLHWAAMQRGDKLSVDARKELKSLVDLLTGELSGNPRTRKGPVSLFLPKGQLEGEDEEVNRREDLHRQFTDRISKLLNSDKKLATYFVYGLLTGHGKFKEGDPGIATHLMSANKDGTDAKVTPIDLDYAEKLVDKIKFQATFKSSAVETKEIEKEWDDFKERKKQLGEKVTLLDDFRQYSFRTVLRAFLSESINYLSGNRLAKVLVEKMTNDELSVVVPPEPQNPKEAIDYLEDAIEYIGDDSYKLFKFLEDDIDITTNSPILDFTEFATPQTLTTNKIYVNGREFNIPVEEPMNYDAGGQQVPTISEGKNRNYRKEYDNYHAKPEQRQNRSKRVLARRLMMKLGKAKKGDGKDIDHKNGNPRDNRLSNLRVRNKSENRADHVD